MKVAIAILNWNGKSFLEQFLPSVVEHSDGAELYVIDNHSTDDSVAFLKEHYPNIQLVINEENGGFAKGYNDGLKQIDADIYVLLNSDIEVTANWIAPVIDLMQSNTSIVACQPKVKSYHNKTQFEHAGAAGGFIDKHGYPFCRGRIFDKIEEDNHQYDDNMEIFWATGACLFIRSEAYHNAGGLDEDFFAHMEEIDLCWRLKNQGHQVWYCGASTVYHVGGGTLNYMSPKKTLLNFRNSLFAITKNYRSGNLFLKLLWRETLDGIAGAKFLFTGQFSHFFMVIKAHFQFYGKLGKMLKKRKSLGANISPNQAGVYKHSIVWKSFVSGIKKYSDL